MSRSFVPLSNLTPTPKPTRSARFAFQALSRSFPHEDTECVAQFVWPVSHALRHSWMGLLCYCSCVFTLAAVCCLRIRGYARQYFASIRVAEDSCVPIQTRWSRVGTIYTPATYPSSSPSSSFLLVDTSSVSDLNMCFSNQACRYSCCIKR